MLAVVSIAVAALLVKKPSRYKLGKYKFTSKQLTVAFGVVALAAIVAVGFTYLKYWPSKPKVPELKVTAQKLDPVKDKKDPGLSEYEIIGQNVNASTTRIEVVTKERDKTKLIAINDSLLQKYRGQSQSFFIDYFDSKEIALTYFSKQTNPQISKAEKDELYKHYIALMIDSPILKMKKFYLQGRPVQELKSY